MNDNDYIVMIDENGQPYLAHAFGDSVKNFASTMNRKIRNNVGKGSRASKDHKYLMRVDNYFSPGKHLYLYTQDEVNAYMGRNGNKAGSRTLSNRIRDKLGWDERSARDDAKANSGSNEANRMRYKAAQDAYSKTALGKLENLGNAAKRHANTTLRAIRNAGKKAGKAIDDLGVDEYVRLQKAKKSGNSRMLDNAQNEWANSTLGKASSSVRRGIDKVGDNVKDAAGKAGKAANGSLESARASLKRTGDKVAEKAKDAWGVDERERLEEATATANANMYNDLAIDSWDNKQQAQKAFDRTPAGVVSKIGNAATDNPIVRTAGNVIDTVATYANYTKDVANAAATAKRYQNAPAEKKNELLPEFVAAQQRLQAYQNVFPDQLRKDWSRIYGT